jgi:putative FmdB family regulatory protein
MIYPYKCKVCGHGWDVEAKVSDPPPAGCPECQDSRVQRLIPQGTTFRLKGGGWADSGYGSSQ